MTELVSTARERTRKATKVAAKLTGDTIGELTDRMYELRERKREIEAQLAQIEGEYKGLEEQLIEKLEAQNTETARGKLASCSITTNTVAHIVDFNVLCAYVKKTGNFQLFQRRISDPSYRELLESGKQVPGLEPFNKKRLNLRTL